VRSASFAGASAVSAEYAPPRPSVVEQVVAYLRGALIIAEMDVRKLRHDPFELATRAIQPVLWLTVFGQAFASIRAIPTGEVGYLAFITPGILAQSLMFVSIFYGLTIIWDRDQGILQKFLVMPVPRASFVAGKALGASVRALSQAMAIFVIALLLGVDLKWSLGGIVGSLLAVVAGSGVFSTISMLIAVAVKTRERFMGLGQVVSMPLFFASNAIYPIAIMPPWLQVIAHVNPLSYIVDLLRGYLVVGQTPNAALDWTVLLVAVAILQAFAGRVYHHVML
jgi:ABC-2 type transport system permease protein